MALLAAAVAMLLISSDASVEAQAKPGGSCERMDCMPGYIQHDETNLPWCWPTSFPYSDCLYCEMRCPS